MRGRRSRQSGQVILGALVVLTVAGVLGAATVIAGSDEHDEPPPPAQPALVTAAPGIAPVAADEPAPTAAGLRRALAGALADPDLGTLGARITDAETGEQLWAQRDAVPLQPASVTKTLTTAAALLTLDRDERLTTTVRADGANATSGAVVLVGAGDATLSAARADEDTWYRGAARISDLAKQVRDSGFRPTAVRVDTSLYTGPDMAVGWDVADIAGGDIAPLQPVMLDAGRIQPTTAESRRSPTPALDAGRALAVALGLDPQTVTVTAAPARGRELGSVQSAPLIERLRQMMLGSDNVMAETIAREVAAAQNQPLSFIGAATAVIGQLRTAGIDVTGADLHDGSGLSVADRLTARTIDEVIGGAAGDDEPRLRPLVDLLPIAGGSGTLSHRFVDPDLPTWVAAGWLRAKTGSLTGTNTLAGIVTDADGRVLTFTFLSNDAGLSGRDALDRVAAVLRSCGCAT